MAITVDYVILPHLRKADGTNFIRLRITHKRKSKYIKTNIAVSPEHMTRSGNLKHQGKIDLATDEVRKYRNIVDAMPTSASDAMDVVEVLRYVTAKLAEEEGFYLKFASYGMRLAEKKKPHTGHNYLTAMRGLIRFFGHDPDISEITVKSMRAFEEYIRNEPNKVFCKDTGNLKDGDKKKNGRAVNQYMSVVKSVYKAARMEFNEPDAGIYRIPVDIFDYYTIPKAPATTPRPIPAEWVQMMIDQRKDLKGVERLGVDVFLISFGLMGINLVDLFNVAEKPKDDVLHYFRTKTMDSKDDRAEMFVRIEPCISDIMKDYLGKDKVFSFHQRYVRDYGFNVAVNNGLKAWIKRNDIQNHFTFYAARHTWPTLAASKRLQIDSAVITEALSHSDQSRRMDKVYTRTDWERVWDANAKVLGLFDWK
jgi:integrase